MSKRTFFIFRWYNQGGKKLVAIELGSRLKAVLQFKKHFLSVVNYHVEKDYLDV